MVKQIWKEHILKESPCDDSSVTYHSQPSTVMYIKKEECGHIIKLFLPLNESALFVGSH